MSDTGAGRLANDNAAVIVAYTAFLPNDEANKALLAELRAMEPPGLTMLVDGGTAEIVDVVDRDVCRLPEGDRPRGRRHLPRVAGAVPLACCCR